VNSACHVLFIQCENCKEEYKGTCSHRCTEALDLAKQGVVLAPANNHDTLATFKKGRALQLGFKQVHNPIDKALGPLPCPLEEYKGQ